MEKDEIIVNNMKYGVVDIPTSVVEKQFLIVDTKNMIQSMGEYSKGKFKWKFGKPDRVIREELELKLQNLFDDFFCLG